jgi:L-alanine-DL-glutamate epimerase-like enolase superfamily enzyme
VKITDDAGNIGWGEASLEGHTQAVEGCLDSYIERYVGMNAEYTIFQSRLRNKVTNQNLKVISSIFGKQHGDLAFIEVARFL